MTTVYVVTGDSRDHGGVLLVTTSIKAAYKRMRRYIVGHNRDRCNLWMSKEVRRMSDRAFVIQYCSAWLAAPGFYRKKLL